MVTNSLEVTSLLGIIVSLVKIVYSTGSTYVKNADTESAYTESLCIEGAYIKGTYLESTCIGVTYIGVGGSYTGSTYTESICTRVAFDKSACVGSFYAIKHSGIHLQSYQNIEVERY